MMRGSQRCVDVEKWRRSGIFFYCLGIVLDGKV